MTKSRIPTSERFANAALLMLMTIIITFSTFVAVQTVQYNNNYKYGFAGPYFWAAIFIETGVFAAMLLAMFATLDNK